MFRGEYQKSSYDGTLNLYSVGDYVLYQGKIFKTTAATSSAPWENDNKWEFTGSTETSISDIKPINPSVGQFWITSGKIYTYYYDGNNFAWVEL